MFFPLCTATASQQEPESEATTEVASRASGLPASTQQTPLDSAATSMEKDSAVEKAKDGVSVSVS